MVGQRRMFGKRSLRARPGTGGGSVKIFEGGECERMPTALGAAGVSSPWESGRSGRQAWREEARVLWRAVERRRRLRRGKSIRS